MPICKIHNVYALFVITLMLTLLFSRHYYGFFIPIKIKSVILDHCFSDFLIPIFCDYQAANDCDLEPVAYEFFTQAFVLYEEEIAVLANMAIFFMIFFVTKMAFSNLCVYNDLGL